MLPRSTHPSHCFVEHGRPGTHRHAPALSCSAASVQSVQAVYCCASLCRRSPGHLPGHAAQREAATEKLPPSNVESFSPRPAPVSASSGDHGARLLEILTRFRISTLLPCGPARQPFGRQCTVSPISEQTRVSRARPCNASTRMRAFGLARKVSLPSRCRFSTGLGLARGGPRSEPSRVGLTVVATVVLWKQVHGSG